VLGREVIEDGESTEMGAPKLHSQGGHGPSIPNDQLSVNPCRADLCDRPNLPFVMSNACDGILMDSEQLGLSLGTSTAGADARDTPGIRVLKGVKGRTVQLPGSTRIEPGRGESRFWSGRIVETSDELPSAFVSGEDVRLAIVTGSNDRVFGGPDEGDERESGHSDGANSGTRSRIDDADGAIVSFRSVLNIIYAGRDKMSLPANARTSPDGEKETVCTQPPAGLANSPQTVPNGSFSPQNVGAGLNRAAVSLLYPQDGETMLTSCPHP